MRGIQTVLWQQDGRRGREEKSALVWPASVAVRAESVGSDCQFVNYCMLVNL